MKIRLLTSLLAFSFLLGACGEDVSTFTLINSSRVEMCEFYLAPGNTAVWGLNQLPNETLDTGESIDIEDVVPGVYRIQAVPCDTNSFEIFERAGIDLSSDFEFTLSDN